MEKIVEETVVEKRTTKEQMIEIWLNTNRATAAESLSFYGQKNMEEINRMSSEYETRITELETNIREKDEELNQLINQLRTIEERKNFLDLDSYSLNIISDKQNWNQLVQHCPINTLYVENEKRDWNELNEISQLDLSIISLGKNWDDLVQEEGRDGVFIAAYEKEPLSKQNINLLQINGTPVFEKWLDEIKVNDIEGLDIVAKGKDENIVEQGTTIEVAGMEKDEPTIQRINLIMQEQ